MTRETMTVHKALAELKLLDKRIEKAIGEGTYCTTVKNTKNPTVNGVSVDEFEKIIQGSFDKVNDLIARRDALKRAVVLSNATTKVEINGTEYTRVEAIDMKNHGMELKTKFLQALKSQYSKAVLKTEDNNMDLDRIADEYIENIYGNKDNVDPEDIAKMREQFVESHSIKLLDPTDVKKKIEKLENEINEFIAEVDAALSVSNAKTLITIEY